MSTGKLGKTTNWDDDVQGGKVLDERNATWGEIPGEIVDIDYEKQTASIQPLYKPKFNGVPVAMPVLLEVPVRFVRAGNGGVTFPVVAGDKVTLRPKMRSSENYHTESDGSASDARSFNLSDMEAHLDGGESLQDPIPNFDSQNTHLRFSPQGDYGIRGSKEGKVAIEGSEGNIYDLLATAIELIAGDGLHILTGSSAGLGIHELENKAQLTEIAAKLRAMAL